MADVYERESVGVAARRKTIPRTWPQARFVVLIDYTVGGTDTTRRMASLCQNVHGFRVIYCPWWLSVHRYCIAIQLVRQRQSIPTQARRELPQSATHLCMVMFVIYFCLFSHFSLGTNFFRKNTKYADMGSPFEVRARSVQCGARGGPPRFFSSGVVRTIALVSVEEALFCTIVPLAHR